MRRDPLDPELIGLARDLTRRPRQPPRLAGPSTAAGTNSKSPVWNLPEGDQGQYLTLATVDGDLVPQWDDLFLDDLGGFDLTGLSEGDTLIWDGENWTPGTQVVPEPHYIQFTIDGGGAAITVGTQIVIDLTHSGTISSWRGLAKESGSQKIDLWVDSYANYPPTDADSITASHEPEISSSTKAQDNDLSDWASGRTVTAGQVLIVNVDSNTSITRVTWRFTITP